MKGEWTRFPHISLPPRPPLTIPRYAYDRRAMVAAERATRKDGILASIMCLHRTYRKHHTGTGKCLVPNAPLVSSGYRFSSHSRRSPPAPCILFLRSALLPSPPLRSAPLHSAASWMYLLVLPYMHAECPRTQERGKRLIMNHMKTYEQHVDVVGGGFLELLFESDLHSLVVASFGQFLRAPLFELRDVDEEEKVAFEEGTCFGSPHFDVAWARGVWYAASEDITYRRVVLGKAIWKKRNPWGGKGK